MPKNNPNMERLVAQAAARQGRALVMWASFNGRTMVRLDRVFLLVMADSGAGVVVVKVPGALSRQGDRVKVVFSDRLVRIKSGDRAKKVVLSDDLRDCEESYPAGMRKILSEGSRPTQLSLGLREGDDSLFTRLLDFLKPVDDLEAIPQPCFTLSSRDRRDYRPRGSGELVAVMRGMPEYKPRASVEDNFQACFDRLAGPQDADGRHAINFKWVDGPGIVKVDADFGVGWSVPLAALRTEAPHLFIEVGI